MSHPLALVRAEIKAWERDFASRHGRDPSLQDIRDHPPIAGKYKLYKKLSKAAVDPSTPPRSHSRLPVPKSRPVESIPLPGFNPFSPVKNSAKHTPIIRSPATQPSRVSPHPNPFATPTKNNRGLRTTTPSPDLFPSILPPHPNAATSPSRDHLVSATAVSRARKRLRGEPVSPSPNKPKRQRVRSRAPLPIPKLDQDSSNSEHELPRCHSTTSFVADSPIKAPAGGKSFKLLFDDVLPAVSTTKNLVSSPLTQFDARLDVGQPADPSAMPLNLQHDLKSKGVTSGSGFPVNCVQGKISTQISPPKGYLSTPSHKPTSKMVSEIFQPRTPVKRALDDGNLVLEHTGLCIPIQSQCPLVPPSPPPQDSLSRDAGRGKAKTTASRKKPRVEDKESDEGVDSSDNITLKIAMVSSDRGKRSCRHADAFDWDPLLHFGTRNHDPAAGEQIDANRHASGTFSVDLPDKFRRVLAISPSSYQNITEERVVHGLLNGGRVGHYDPSRGGDIWDAGETDEGAQGDAETEDDWEDEPVPWEVGEL